MWAAIELALLPSMALPVAVQRDHITAEGRPGLAELLLSSVALYGAFFAAAHALLNLFAYRGLAGEDLRQALRAAARMDEPRSRLARIPVLRSFVRMPSAHNVALQMAVVSLVAIIVIGARESLRSQVTNVGGAMVVVVASWLEVLTLFAILYARLDADDDDSLTFSGAGPRTMSNDTYFALAVQTTFGTTDVEVSTTQTMRQVSRHALLSFVFNTLLLALLIGLLGG